MRIKRRLIHRLMGFEHLYQTKLTDGHHVAYGRGATPKASKQRAQRNWDAMTTTELSASPVLRGQHSKPFAVEAME